MTGNLETNDDDAKVSGWARDLVDSDESVRLKAIASLANLPHHRLAIDELIKSATNDLVGELAIVSAVALAQMGRANPAVLDFAAQAYHQAIGTVALIGGYDPALRLTYVQMMAGNKEWFRQLRVEDVITGARDRQRKVRKYIAAGISGDVKSAAKLMVWFEYLDKAGEPRVFETANKLLPGWDNWFRQLFQASRRHQKWRRRLSSGDTTSTSSNTDKAALPEWITRDFAGPTRDRWLGRFVDQARRLADILDDRGDEGIQEAVQIVLTIAGESHELVVSELAKVKASRYNKDLRGLSLGDKQYHRVWTVARQRLNPNLHSLPSQCHPLIHLQAAVVVLGHKPDKAVEAQESNRLLTALHQLVEIYACYYRFTSHRPDDREANLFSSLLHTTTLIREATSQPPLPDFARSSEIASKLEALLDHVKTDDNARQQFLDLLDELGAEDPRTAAYRRQLTARLY